MKKGTTKLLLLLVVLIMVMTGAFSACSTSEEATDDATGTEESTTSEETTSTESEETQEEGGIIWSGEISVASYMFAPLDDEQDIVTPVIEETLLEYGYDVDLECVYIEYSQYEELMNTRIAGGNAPDIFLSLSLSTMREYYNQGAIASWDTDFFIENAPNLYEYIMGGGVDGNNAEFVDLFWEFATVDEEMITIPKFAESGSMPYKAVIYRGDWLENLGVTELPTTVEDYIELMYRFTNEDPDQNGEDDTFGFSSTMIRALFGAYGNYNGFIGDSPQWYEVDGEMICADLMDSNKEVLEILAQLYDDGVLHPEFITGENTGGYWAISHQFVNGEIGVSCLASIDHYRTADITGEAGTVAQEYYAVNGDDAEFVYGPWPAGPDGDYGYAIGYGTNVGENAVYNAELNNDTEKLAAIFNIMDIFVEDFDLAMLVQYGVEGETYESYGEGDSMYATMTIDNETANAMGIWAYRSLYGADSPYNELIQRMIFNNNPTVDNRLTYQAQDQFDSYYVNDLYTTLPSEGDYAEDLKTYRDETWINIIKGDLDISYWDTFVEEYLAMGGQTLIDEANEWLNSK